jgi:hypothetical protein
VALRYARTGLPHPDIKFSRHAVGTHRVRSGLDMQLRGESLLPFERFPPVLVMILPDGTVIRIHRLVGSGSNRLGAAGLRAANLDPASPGSLGDRNTDCQHAPAAVDLNLVEVEAVAQV